MKTYNSAGLALVAQAKGYAIPAFNMNGGNYDITRAILEAAHEMDSPVIMQCAEINTDYRGFDYTVKLIEHLSNDLTVPVAIHLDHGKSTDAVISAVKAGYTSVMLDYGSFPIGENIAMMAYSSDTASDLIELWASSPGHRSNMLSYSYHRTGFAKNGKYAVQIFD